MPALIFCREAARANIPALAAVLAFLLLLPVLAAGSAHADGKPLVLEDYFRGRTVGEGVFESRIAGIRRPFTVVTHGTWNPKTLDRKSVV